MNTSATSEHNLLSNVIPFDKDGNYSFEVLDLLIPHEAFRRELQRGKKAIDALDGSSPIWKFEALHEWLEDFLFAIMKTHHDIEDMIIFPFYYALGVIVPDKETEDHMTLQGKMVHSLNCLMRILRSKQQGSETNLASESLKELKLVFNQLVEEYKRHFDEEERFWPAVIKQFGENAFNVVIGHVNKKLLSYGDHNAGDPSRNYICSTANSLGLVFGEENIEDELLPWGGAELQQIYLKRFSGAKSWNGRYLEFRKLIQAIASSSASAPPVNKNSRGKFVNSIRKKPIPVILFFALCLLFCATTIPFFAALSNPLRNVKYLHIKYVNYDNGIVGSSFTEFINSVSASSDTIPTFQFEDNTVDFVTLQRRVLDGEAWAIISVNANATENLAAAVANGCEYGSFYNSSNAITYSWDEGRNSIVSDPYVDAFVNGQVIPPFMGVFAATYLSSLSPTTVSSCIANGQSQLLIVPVNYTTNNLTPVDVSYVANSAGLTLGNILMAVFGAMFIVMATYNGTASLCEDLSPIGKLTLKAVTMASIGFGIAICYATTIVELTRHGSSHHLYNSYEWSQLFGEHVFSPLISATSLNRNVSLAVQYLHILIWMFGMSCVAEGIALPVVPIFFAFTMIYSVLGGWNVDVCDQGYRHFFQIFPFHWVIYIQRYTLYGSLGYHRGISAGILVAYFILVFVMYFYLGLKTEYHRLANDIEHVKLTLKEELKKDSSGGHIVAVIAVKEEEDEGNNHNARSNNYSRLEIEEEQKV